MHSTIISLGFQVSGFAGNSRAQNLNKEQTKRANITGVQNNFRGSTGSGVNFLLSFLLCFISVLITTFSPSPWWLPTVTAAAVRCLNTVSNMYSQDTVSATTIPRPTCWVVLFFVRRFYAVYGDGSTEAAVSVTPSGTQSNFS